MSPMLGRAPRLPYVIAHVDRGDDIERCPLCSLRVMFFCGSSYGPLHMSQTYLLQLYHKGSLTPCELWSNQYQYLVTGPKLNRYQWLRNGSPVRGPKKRRATW